MTFPENAKVGDLFFMNEEPVRISAWNYTYKTFGDSFDLYFDLEFVDIAPPLLRKASTMLLIPMGYDFYGVSIREMTPLEKELYT